MQNNRKPIPKNKSNSSVIIYLILIFSVSSLEPDFVVPLENVTIAQGRDATFTCVVNNLGGYRVSSDPNATPARVCIGVLFL